MLIAAISIVNLIRLWALLLLSLLLYPFLKNRAVFFFFKHAGPSFIKLGQSLATRPDLVGEHLAKTLSFFQDRLEPFCEKKVRKILQREFGKNFDKKFSEFNFVACASASIAQVHKARLASGEEVAVKILRPNIRRIMRRDIATLGLLAKITKIFSRDFAKAFGDVNSVLREAAKTELNLLKEAANAMRLKQELAGVAGFYVPHVFLAFSSENILVIEWIDGVPFSNKKAIEATEFDKTEIARNLVVSYFTQVYSNGFFHADMHQGNLFLLTKGENKGAIAVVDFGIMGEIDKKTRLAIAEIFIGFLHRDYHEVAQLHVRAGLVPANTNIYDLALACQKIGEKIVDSSVKEISLAALLMHLIKMTHEYKMSTRPELLLLQKTLILVEGVGVMLDENLNIWDLARPWVKEWAKKNIGFDAKIRDALVGLFEALKVAARRYN